MGTRNDPPSAQQPPKQQASGKRHDPPSLVVDGDITTTVWWDGLDKNRHYVEANPNDGYCGVAEMEREGFEIEVARDGGPCLRGGKASADGSALTRHGMVLMSCPLEHHIAREEKKRQVAAQRSAAIGQKGGIDQVRGPLGRLAEYADDPSEQFVRA